MEHATVDLFLAWLRGLKRGQGSNIIKFQLQIVCLLSQIKDIKHIRRDFHSCACVMPQGYGVGAGGGHGHVAYQNKRDDEGKRIQVKCLPYGQTRDLGMGSKGQISLKFNCRVNFKDFYTKL